MSKVKMGVVAGLIFGIIDIIPMFFMGLPGVYIAVTAAFINRFTIGFLIPNLSLPFPGWVTGLIVGILLSLPDAIITNAYIPIMGFGIIGGFVIGLITLKK